MADLRNGESFLETRIYVGAQRCVVAAIVEPEPLLEGMVAEIGV
jgi:hypothetical protein